MAKKKCKDCKAEIKTYTTYEGKRYNTVNRAYCMECSPPKNASVAQQNDKINAQPEQPKVIDMIQSSGDNIAQQVEIPRHFFGPLAGQPRWVHGVDDLEDDLHFTYKFCEECNYSFTTSVEMKKEKIRKRGTTIPDYVYRYCHECYDIVCARKFAEKIATKILQTSKCDKCRIKHHTYVPYSSLLKCRVTNDEESYDMICLSCENDMDNGFINEVEENMEDDIEITF